MSKSKTHNLGTYGAQNSISQVPALGHSNFCWDIGPNVQANLDIGQKTWTLAGHGLVSTCWASGGLGLGLPRFLVSTHSRGVVWACFRACHAHAAHAFQSAVTACTHSPCCSVRWTQKRCTARGRMACGRALLTWPAHALRWLATACLSPPPHLAELALAHRHPPTWPALCVPTGANSQVQAHPVTATYSPLGLGLRSCQAQISLRTVGGSAKTGHLGLVFWKSQALKDQVQVPL